MKSQIETRLAALEAVVFGGAAHTGFGGGRVYVNDMADYDPVTRSVRRREYDELGPEDRELLQRQREREQRAGVVIPVLGERFVVNDAITTFGLNEDDAYVIHRSTEIAGSSLNQPRWAYADATSDEKLPRVTAIGKEETVAAVISAKLEALRYDESIGADPNDPRFVSGG